MTKFAQMFDQVPVGRTVVSHWNDQDSAVLDVAASIIDAHGANPWAFAADERHFWQFASADDVAALQAMDDSQQQALLYWRCS